MIRFWRALVLALACAAAAPAGAQTLGTGDPQAPIVDSWYLGVNTGTAVVEKLGAAAGLDGGLRFWRNLDAIVDLAWGQNTVSRRQLDQMRTVAAAVSQQQGGSVEGTMKVGTRYGGLGVRWVFEDVARIKPYALLTIGAAHIDRQPTLLLRGGDITASAAQYGVTFGKDLAGKYNVAGASGGFGVVTGLGPVYIDAGIRIISLSQDGTRTNVSRLVLGGGYRF